MNRTREDDMAPAIGHNSRTLVDMLSPAAIRYELGVATETLVERRNAMIEMCAAFAADHPEIASDEQQATGADVLRQAKACGKQLEDSRISAKEPFLAGCRVVDGFFAPVRERLFDAMAPVQQALNRRMERITAHKRAIAQAEAEAAAERAQVAEEDARAKATSEAFDAAIAAAEEAAVAEARAAVKAADLTRVHTDLGGVASGREEWHFEVIDEKAVPDEFWVLDLQAIGRAVRRRENPLRKAPGLRIFSTITARVR